jgi:flagellar FliL protein
MALTAATPASAEELDLPDVSAAPPKKSGSKKIIIIAILGVLVLGLSTAAGLYFMGMLGGSKAVSASAVKAPKDHAYLDLPGILVNIAGTPKQQFLRLVVSIELDSPGDIGKIKPLLPRVIDRFQVYLRELRLDDIKGASGMHRMHEELLANINEAVAPVVVSDLLFKEMTIQ